MANPKTSLLHNLISQGEHQQQDFKYKIDDAPKLARSVSAFANTDGGRLLIGVRDDGTIHGVRSEEEIFMMHAVASTFCTPEPSIQLATYHVPANTRDSGVCTVVVCTVLPFAERPVYALEDGRRTAYVRVDDENIVASPVHLSIWRQDAHLRGEAFSDTPPERSLLTVLAQHPEGVPLNRLCKQLSSLSRPRVILLLARFIRFGLARIERREQQWMFFPAE